jgi:transposase-like protein
LVVIEIQRQIIWYLCFLVLGKAFKPRADECDDIKYLKLAVDPLPVFGEPVKQRWLFTDLLEDYRHEHGKDLKPVIRRGGKSVPADAICPYCAAPPEYVYDNNGGRGAFWCKVCNSKFAISKPSIDSEPYCPFCLSKLPLLKKRKTFDVYRCSNMECPYRKQKLAAMVAVQKALYKKSPHLFKLRYIYRKFRWDFTPLSKDSIDSPLIVDLPNIKASPHILGLILTYHVNYGLSLRKTAALMYDVHSVMVSHQTIANYCHAVAPRVKPFVDGFDYNLSDSFCGDETYIKVKGTWHYLFFFFDAAKKIILSYRVQKLRDWMSAVLAINDVLVKLKDIPDNLNLITDGNPIYLLARLWFAQHGINFDVTQVIGLTNEDEVSKKYRPLKQIIERLNRTFKGNYKPTGGYSADFGAISSVTLFVAYFNFLRPHSKLEGNVPVLIPELNSLPNMPAKWLKLIALSEEFIKSKAA